MSDPSNECAVSDQCDSTKSVSRDWPLFSGKLTSVLSKLEEDQYLIVSAKTGNRFVQFACQGAWGMRVEVTSNHFLEDEDRLNRRQMSWLTFDNRMEFETMVLANREPTNEADKDTPELAVFKSVEAVLKGIEVPLPSPYKFIDKDGHVRNRVRVRWWDNEATDYWRASMLPDDERAGFPQTPVPPHTLIGHDGGKPVFVGHYWLTGTPALLSNKVACVDDSVAKGGQLVAYRWDGEPELDNRKLKWVQP